MQAKKRQTKTHSSSCHKKQFLVRDLVATESVLLVCLFPPKLPSDVSHCSAQSQEINEMLENPQRGSFIRVFVWGEEKTKMSHGIKPGRGRGRKDLTHFRSS